ncbi:DUF2066 domain-containing protein [Thalassotalea ponticola]|uniref:DUF2066 domain-containing protein n=1 Tax=Thalassotalea ponticola TaxID=1523392 RepID=UPI0025B3531F|nr:DUF2066 domain-containing protein [Thalassotalea ponticola]MDN3653021.1 DUF2066 domain-containing protein [Thalassotalea ponticola]
MKLTNILKPLTWGITFASFMSSFASQAIEIDDLYQAKVNYSQEQGGRDKAYRQALEQVLVKLAGRDFVRNNDELKQALSKPSKFLSEYRFNSIGEQPVLQAEFEVDKIDGLLRQVNAPVWGKHRPLIAVWMIDEQGSSRTVIDDSNQQVKQQLQHWFNQRGLAVRFPLMDLTDAMITSNSDIWGRFKDTIVKASQRYSADAVLVLRVSDSTLVNAEIQNTQYCAPLDDCNNTAFAGDWQLWNGDLNLRDGDQQSDKVSLLESLVFDVAQALHDHYSVVLNDNSLTYVDIEIVNVTSMKDFVSVSNFFSQLSLVNDVTLTHALGNKRVFRISTYANVDAIMQALRLEQNLMVNNDTLYFDKQGNQPVSFYWKG